MAGYMDTSAQDSLPSEALEMWSSEIKSGQLLVDNIVDAKTSLEDGSEETLGVLLGRVKSAAASLRYLSSKATILTVPGLNHPALEDVSSFSEVATEDGASCSLKMLQSIQMVADVLESLLRKVTSAESETSFQKERLVVREEEIRRKTVQIENMSLRLGEMKRILNGNKTMLDETEEIIKKLVEDSRRAKEIAVENEEELRRVKTECESLRNYVNTITSPDAVETLLSSDGQLHCMLVAKSTQLEGEKAQKEVEIQKLMEENVKLATLLDKKEAQLLALNEQCKFMALNASNI
ncbi:unnamed protein product [Microthlaspi erraticum]|uniref:Uncharacterized protein n=1 Tax=Microthlaspi erraticum TaxID=1685480 RepID=A0A6D2J496_9BRAS|nr:unnamed protein product [Microthlaspi erraticum]